MKTKHTTFKLIDTGKNSKFLRYESLLNLTYEAYKMHFLAKCNSCRISIQWFHIMHYFNYQFTKKLAVYHLGAKKLCFAQYTTSVPWLLGIARTDFRLCESVKIFTNWVRFSHESKYISIHGNSWDSGHVLNRDINASVTFALRRVYDAHTMSKSPFPCSLCRETLRSSYGFGGIVASTILFDSAQWQTWKNRKPVDTSKLNCMIHVDCGNNARF